MICVDLCVALVASSGISGYIIDATGNFDLPYYLFGLCGIVGSALMYVVAVIQWKSKHAPDKVNKLPTDRNAVIFSNGTPFRGEAQIKILWGSEKFVVIILKVEEVSRGKGPIHTPFRGGAQIKILWGSKNCEVIILKIEEVRRERGMFMIPSGT